MKVDKVILISPASSKTMGKTQKRVAWYTKAFRFSQQLGLLYVAASLPGDVDVQIVDATIEPTDFSVCADLIGITCMTVQAPRAYEIADQFRNRGIKVLLGGYHPTFMPQEALEHADVICSREAEYNVPRIIQDMRGNRLRRIYDSNLVELEKLPFPNRNLLHRSAYIVDSIQTSRGCNHGCMYCSGSVFFKHRRRTRPLEKVIEEMKRLGKYLLFLDSNVVGDRNYAIDLFKAMKQLGKRWVSQCCVEIADDPELLKLASEGGCRGLFIGFESLSQKNLGSVQKGFNLVKRYAEQIKRIHDNNISVLASFMFGMDDDDKDVFERTIEFLDWNKIDALNALIQTPFPGTRLYARLEQEGRLMDKNWDHYDFHHVVFEPKSMSAGELQEGSDRVLHEFYSTKRVAKRLSDSMRLGPEAVLRGVMPVNMTYWHNILRNKG